VTFLGGAVPLDVGAEVYIHWKLITTHMLPKEDTFFLQKLDARFFSKRQLWKFKKALIPERLN
jgi:hypothetical protein